MSFIVDKYAVRPGCCTTTFGTDEQNNQTVTIDGPCYYCKKPQSVKVMAADFTKFQQGGFAQDCFPKLSAGDREFLISGICDDCWHQMFGLEADDDEDI
jgi:hypothetical protein